MGALLAEADCKIRAWSGAGECCVDRGKVFEQPCAPLRVVGRAAFRAEQWPASPCIGAVDALRRAIWV